MDLSFASSLIKYFELIAGIIGIITFIKCKKDFWYYFAISLIVLFFLECIGYYLKENQYGKYNMQLYKFIIIPFLFVTYHFLFYNLLLKHKKFVVVSLYIFVLMVLFENIFLFNAHSISISISVAFGCLMVSIGSLAYFFQLVKSDEILYFKNKMGFWACIGLLIFYVGSFVKLTFFNSLAISRDSYFANALTLLFIFLNYIMYTLFAIGFIICSKPKL